MANLDIRRVKRRKIETRSTCISNYFLVGISVAIKLHNTLPTLGDVFRLLLYKIEARRKNTTSNSRITVTMDKVLQIWVKMRIKIIIKRECAASAKECVGHLDNHSQT